MIGLYAILVFIDLSHFSELDGVLSTSDGFDKVLMGVLL